MGFARLDNPGTRSRANLGHPYRAVAVGTSVSWECVGVLWGMLQIFLQPGYRTRQLVSLVLTLHESVPFFRIVNCLYRATLGLKDVDHLFGFFTRNTDIVVAL